MRPAGKARSDRGSAAVEFVLVLPAVLLVALALVEIAVVARIQLDLMHASRVAAREAAASPDPSRAVDAAVLALGQPLADHARVSITRPAVVGRQAEVEVSLRYRAFEALLGGIPVELRARSVMRVER